MRTCDIDGCENIHMGRGLCSAHYREKFKKEISVKRHIRYLKNRPKCLEYSKKRRAETQEYEKERHRKYRQENKEKLYLANVLYREKNIEKVKAFRKKYYQENKVELRRKNKIYFKTPKGKAVLKSSAHKRRLLESDLTTETVQRVYEDNIKKHGTLTCVLCFKPIEFGKDSLEHKTPLSRGGNNDYDNLGIAHRTCNNKKNSKTMEEWFSDKKNRKRKRTFPKKKS